MRSGLMVALVAGGLVFGVTGAGAEVSGTEVSLLNVSYDVSRELYKDINPAFAASWQAAHGETVTIKQSHGGSSKQALSVAAGLEADVVTMNQAPDIDILVERGGLVDGKWREAFPHGAAPYTTVTVFLVRKGNPKGIKDWSDLVRDDVQAIVPNPKTSGNGRYTYLAAWGYALDKFAGEAEARAFVTRLFANVPVLDGGGRGATTTFTQRDVGDVLITFENEAALIARELEGSGPGFDIVYPSVSIEAAAPVAVVGKVAARHGTKTQAKAYLDFLFSPEGQEIIARHDFRPRDPEVFARHAAKYPVIRTFSVESALGGWDKVQKLHFADGGLFDQIIIAAKR
ncbi:MAG: sulfate ABC transporter substrate-binding protein [Azoarcus sp.]|jgi:sulfate transport system substrate-binding protein|nr:sulfate ABC transporter substrate-binding protein [Azoarcus sp.]